MIEAKYLHLPKLFSCSTVFIGLIMKHTVALFKLSLYITLIVDGCMEEEHPTPRKAVFVRAHIILNFDVNFHFYTRPIYRLKKLVIGLLGL